MKRHLQTIRSAKPTDVRDAADTAAKSVAHAIDGVPGLVRATKEEKKRVLKPPTGAERYVSQMAELASDNATLRPKNVDPAVTLEHLAFADGLDKLRATLADALALIDGSRLVAYGAAYSDALDILALARAHARTDGTIEKDIAGFVEFLRKGPHAAPEATPTKS